MSDSRRELRRFILLLVLFCGIAAAIDALWGAPLRSAVSRASAATAAWLMGPSAEARGMELRVDGRALLVDTACTAVPFAAIFLCAVMAWPAPWRRRLLAFPVALAAFFVLQQIRVLVLARLTGPGFAAAHTLSGAAFAASLLGLWLLWTRHSGSSLRWSLRNPGAAASILLAFLAAAADLAFAQGPPPPPDDPIPLGGAGWALAALVSGAAWTIWKRA